MSKIRSSSKTNFVYLYIMAASQFIISNLKKRRMQLLHGPILQQTRLEKHSAKCKKTVTRHRQGSYWSDNTRALPSLATTMTAYLGRSQLAASENRKRSTMLHSTQMCCLLCVLKVTNHQCDSLK